MNPQSTEFVFRRLFDDFPNIIVGFPVAFAFFVVLLITLFKPTNKLRTFIVGVVVVGLFAAVHIPLALLFKPQFSWWVVLAPLLGIALFYVGLMYRKDCQTIHPAIAAFLGLLRCTVYAILAFVFLLPGCQSYDTAEQNSQVTVLFDVSGSMKTKDDLLEPGQRPDSLLTRQDKVLEFLTRVPKGADQVNNASFWDKLLAKSPVKVYRFGTIADEVQVKTFNKDMPAWEISEWKRWLNPTKAEISLPEKGTDEEKEKAKAKMQDLIDSLVNGTNVGGSALQVAKTEAPAYNQAIIIFSDGQSNTGSDEAGRDFVARMQNPRRPVHVFTVGVGEYRTPAQIRIDDLQAPQLARPDDKFPVRVPVVGTGLADEEFDVFVDLKRVKDSAGSPITDKKFTIGPKKGKFKGAGDNPQDTVEFEVDLQELRQVRLQDDKARELEGEWKFVARVPRHARESFADPEHVSNPPTRVQVQNKELRVLLFAGGPTRDYQFVRTLLFREVQEKRMEMSVYLQTGKGDTPNVDQDVEGERLLTHFPDKIGADDPKDKYSSLSMYDVIIAIDPDWTALDKSQIKLVEKWVNNDAGGIIFVAGPVNTYYLARLTPELAPLRSILPVELKDSRLSPFTLGLGIDMSKPYLLNFPPAVKNADFMKLDEAGEGPTAGWEKFFWGDRKPEPGKQPDRGIYNYYPVKSIRADTTVLAEFMGPEGTRLEDVKKSYQPYIATMRSGSGKTVYISSGETWRLRHFKSAFHERFWIKIARFASSGGTQQKKYGRILLGRKVATGPLTIEAQLKGADLLPLSKDFRPVVQVKRRGDQDAKPVTYDLKAKNTQGDWTGWFSGTVKLREPGEYVFTIPIPNTSESLTHILEVYQPNLEEVNVRENHKALYQLATDAGPVLNRLPVETREEVKKVLQPSSLDFQAGKEGTKLFLPLASADVITKCLLNVPPKKERTKGALEDLWDKGMQTELYVGNLRIDFAFVLIAVVGLLGIEWLTRKLLKLA